MNTVGVREVQDLGMRRPHPFMIWPSASAGDFGSGTIRSVSIAQERGTGRGEGVYCFYDRIAVVATNGKSVRCASAGPLVGQAEGESGGGVRRVESVEMSRSVAGESLSWCAER